MNQRDIELLQALKQKYVYENQNEWIKRGQYYKGVRIESKVSHELIALELGVTKQRIERFEAGEPIRDHKLLENAYRNVLDVYRLSKGLGRVEEFYFTTEGIQYT